ncbi:hypothetical protein [Enterobacter cloacae complex sp. ESBL7]|uniref:hypothetical protein n=1 Tax=Enterobacter cloacae complex sp. ESBL7 TaxID=3163325 RepID=UPI003567DF56
MVVSISIAVISVISFCPVIECSECKTTTCPFDRHYANRLEKAKSEYDEAYKNLLEKEANLRMVVLYG